MMKSLLASLLALTFVACGDDDSPSVDAGFDASPSDAGHDAALGEDGGAADASAEEVDAASPSDAGPSCLDEYDVGDEIVSADHCNVCTCGAEGRFVCTERVCPETADGSCEYAGTTHAYGERFPATDDCNECVCAASGLACTRRACSEAEEGAILLEALDQPCGREGFTAQSVLQDIPFTELDAPFVYERDRDFYPETRADTTLRLSLHYVGGFLVCRIPSETQVAMDIEIAARWRTADGAFDEVLHAYLRRNDFGFVDSWTTVASRRPGDLVGDYTPDCLDPGSLAFAAEIGRDESASATVHKTCETDIGLGVGAATIAAP